MEISQNFLIYIGVILAGTEFLKKILGKSGYSAIIIAFIVGILEGIRQFGADGTLTYSEIATIVSAVISANGVYILGFSRKPSAIENLKIPPPEKG